MDFIYILFGTEIHIISDLLQESTGLKLIVCWLLHFGYTFITTWGSDIVVAATRSAITKSWEPLTKTFAENKLYYFWGVIISAIYCILFMRVSSPE